MTQMAKQCSMEVERMVQVPEGFSSKHPTLDRQLRWLGIHCFLAPGCTLSAKSDASVRKQAAETYSAPKPLTCLSVRRLGAYRMSPRSSG